MTTRKRKPRQDPKVVERFLKQHGLKRVTPGKEVDHRIPPEDGGKDTSSNLQLLTKKQHDQKTACEARARAQKKKPSKKS